MDEAQSQGPPGFLASLGAPAAVEFERLGRRRRVPAGEMLFLEGDRADEVLVLLAGEVKISVGSLEGREVILDVLEPGALVGELSAIDGKPRSATVTAISAVEVLAVGAGPSTTSSTGIPTSCATCCWRSSNGSGYGCGINSSSGRATPSVESAPA